MTIVESLSKFESKLRPFFLRLNKRYSTSFYSNQKKKFLKRFSEDHKNFEKRNIGQSPVKIWDLNFNIPIYNAAGMFKYGESYYTVAKQGAGAWLTGTTTGNPRSGNFKNGILHPFIPLPESKSSLNWMGLPNKGHLETAKIISKINKIENCPIGVSMSYDPGLEDPQALELMLEGIKAYQKAGVDFIEINESCPNVADGHTLSNTKLDEGLINRIEYLNKEFLKDNTIPVLIKLSNDTSIEMLEDLSDLLSTTHFSGINFGNTSTKYSEKIEMINNNEKSNFQHFRLEFGGGISGRPLRDDSLRLCSSFSQLLTPKKFKRDFRIISTGGIENIKDINQSLEAGASLCNWYTGYFNNFSKYGHNTYKNLY